MPALIGGFGKIILDIMKKDFTSKNDEVIRVSPLRNSDSKNTLTENTSQNSNTQGPSKLGPYLAGLIEQKPQNLALVV
jgi:hypothetical protein